MTNMTVDARGLNCPLPILKARKALNELPIGGTLEVLSTDPGSAADFAAFARQTGNELLSSQQDTDCFRHVLKRCG
jgi:tRNA 2-thiouridine synthesizing protein A